MIDPYFTDYGSSTIENENKEEIIISERKYGDKTMGWDEVFYNVVSDWLVTVH